MSGDSPVGGSRGHARPDHAPLSSAAPGAAGPDAAPGHRSGPEGDALRSLLEQLPLPSALGCPRARTLLAANGALRGLTGEAPAGTPLDRLLIAPPDFDRALAQDRDGVFDVQLRGPRSTVEALLHTRRTVLDGQPHVLLQFTPLPRAAPAPEPSVRSFSAGARLDLDALVQMAPVALLTVDPDRRRVVFCNAAFRTLSASRIGPGSPLDEVEALFVTDQDRQRVLAHRDDGDELHETEVRLRCGDGRIAAAMVSGVHQRTPDGMLVTVFLTDLSELRRVELQFQQAQKMEALGNLSSGVAHDFNNLLGAIRGYGELLRDAGRDPDEGHRLAERTRDYGERILSATRIAADLTHKLLVFARGATLQLERVDTHELLQQAIDILAHAIDKRIEIVTDLAAAGRWIRADRNQLLNAVINLGLNARDAMHDGGWLRIRTRDFHGDAAWCARQPLRVEPGPYLRIDVEDTGSGIPEAFHQSIFEPFFSTKEQGKGTGLGLAAVYGTLSSHGGTIGLRSSPDEGSCFSLFLPCSAEAPALAPEPRPGRRPTLVQGSGHVLLVDDEALLRNMTREMLQRLGYRVTAVADGVEAIRAFSTQAAAVDAVLLDLTMPRMNGVDTQRRLRAIRADVPVLLMSGWSETQDAETALDEGALGLLHKPFQFADFAQAVARAVKGERLEG